MLVRLTTLGAARVHSGETDLPDLPAQRLRFALLLYLAVERDVAREEVVALFWPERDTARGRHALRQMLYELRQVLGEEWIDMRRDRIVVRAAVDALEFEGAVEAGRLADAAALYGGPFLHGFALENRSFEAWAERRRGHLARLHRRLQRDHIGAQVADGRADEALSAAQRWVELDPLDDEAVHTLIERLAAAGERTAALQYYDNYVRQLDAELEVEPLEETQALIASIRNGDAVSPSVDSQPDAAASAMAGSPNGPVERPDPASLPQSPRRAPGHTVDRRSVRVPLRRRPREIWRAASVARRSVAVASLAVLVSVIGYMTQGSPAGATLSDSEVVVAMMPIEDTSPDGSLMPLAESLTDDLTRALARSGQLAVRSANAVRVLRGRGVPENEIGTTLGATYMLDGRMSVSDDVVRVVIELLDGDGMMLQGRTIERPLSESRNLNQDVARVAGEFLRSELRVPVHVWFAESGASSEEAFLLVGKARELQSVTGSMLEAGEKQAALAHLARADSLLALAASKDPGWAEPVVRRGWNLERRATVAALSRDTVLHRKFLEQALSIADQAERLGTGSAEVHALRGTVMSKLADVAGRPSPSVLAMIDSAEAELNLATQLDPSNEGAWLILSQIQTSAGRYGEALHSARAGFRTAGPQSQPFLLQLWATEFETGDDLQADGWCSQLWRVKPSLPGLYCNLVLQAWGGSSIAVDVAAARRAMAHIQKSDVRIQPEILPRFQTLLAAVYARSGQPDSAHAILDRVTDADLGVLWLRAGVHAILGEDSAAVTMLDRYMAADPMNGARIVRSRPFWDLGTRVDLDGLIASRNRLADVGPGSSQAVSH